MEQVYWDEGLSNLAAIAVTPCQINLSEDYDAHVNSWRSDTMRKVSISDDLFIEGHIFPFFAVPFS